MTRLHKLGFAAGVVWVLVMVTLAVIGRSSRSTAPPLIVTVFDTTHDTLRLWVPLPAPKRSGPNLVISQAVHDTVNINAGEKPAERTNVWPVTSLTVGRKVGDTTVANTFSLRTGQGGVSRFYTTGPLLSMWADSTATPRLEFGPPPRPAHVSLWTKITWGTLGYGGCKVVDGLTGLLH